MSDPEDIKDCPLHRRTPFLITNVTQFSIARYYGGIKFNREMYTYFPDTDFLIRDDVLRWQKKVNKPMAVGRRERNRT